MAKKPLEVKIIQKTAPGKNTKKQNKTFVTHGRSKQKKSKTFKEKVKEINN